LPCAGGSLDIAGKVVGPLVESRKRGWQNTTAGEAESKSSREGEEGINKRNPLPKNSNHLKSTIKTTTNHSIEKHEEE